MKREIGLTVCRIAHTYVVNKVRAVLPASTHGLRHIGREAVCLHADCGAKSFAAGQLSIIDSSNVHRHQGEHAGSHVVAGLLSRKSSTNYASQLRLRRVCAKAAS